MLTLKYAFRVYSNIASMLVRGRQIITAALCILCCSYSVAFQSPPYFLDTAKQQSFAKIYQEELGDAIPCEKTPRLNYTFCFEPLRNQGNAPYILMPRQKPRAVVVLFHGLSDSPFFVKSIAESLQKQGLIVIAPLTPGHGKKQADEDMQDENLQKRWIDHANIVMDFALDFDLPVIAGGFSTGAVFAVHYSMTNPIKPQALLLFSGALELSGGAEAMGKIWGMKGLAKWLDGEYQTQGNHPYKYPKVASYSGLVLLDIIKEIREGLPDANLDIPMFAAHSMADRVTLVEGIEKLSQQISGNHTIFKIDEEYDLCHGDLPMSSVQIINMKFSKKNVNVLERCAVPKANPLFVQMTLMMRSFVDQILRQQESEGES